MRACPSWLLASAALLPFSAPAAAHVPSYRFHYDHVLGTSLDVTAVAVNPAAAVMAVTAARREVERLDGVLSAWREDSELQQLNRVQAAQVSPALYEVVARCEDWRTITGGAFDCRLGGPLALWREADTVGRGIDPADLERTLGFARSEVRLDPRERLVHRPDGLRLTIDGMAKGYIIDAALEAARQASPELRGLMIDIGGDLRCWGRPPQASGWRVGVASTADADNSPPAMTLRLGDHAVAASGRGMRDLRTADGARSPHLAAPSGRPQDQVQNAVVVARSAADADALATAFMVMTPHQALALADQTADVATLVIGSDGTRHASRGWADLVDREPRPRLIRTADPTPAPVQQNLSLDLTYQVPKIENGRYHAPYVVMWLTDENDQLVRTLLMLGRKRKWASENFVWWRRYGRLSPQALDAVARPTRLPGLYTAHWDGKDEAGHAAPPGRYRLHIEAARERGGHTYQAVDIDLSGVGGGKALPAKDEMGPVDLRFSAGG